MGLLSAALLLRIRLWILSWHQHRIVLRRLGRLGLGRLGLGLGPELVPGGVFVNGGFFNRYGFRSGYRGRFCRQSGVAARRESPFGSLVPEPSTRVAVRGRIDGLAERDDQVELQLGPWRRHGKLEPVWCRERLDVREPLGRNPG